MGIGENIKRLRESRGMTQEEMGAIADVSAMAVSQWENGRAVPRMGAVERIARYFGVTKSELIEDSGVDYATMRLDDLSTDERELLDIYRSLDTRARHDLLRIAASLSAARNIDSGLSASA